MHSVSARPRPCYSEVKGDRRCSGVCAKVQVFVGHRDVMQPWSVAGRMRSERSRSAFLSRRRRMSSARRRAGFRAAAKRALLPASWKRPNLIRSPPVAKSRSTHRSSPKADDRAGRRARALRQERLGEDRRSRLDQARRLMNKTIAELKSVTRLILRR
jgi:hypothetical protein